MEAVQRSARTTAARQVGIEAAIDESSGGLNSPCRADLQMLVLLSQRY